MDRLSIVIIVLALGIVIGLGVALYQSHVAADAARAACLRRGGDWVIDHYETVSIAVTTGKVTTLMPVQDPIYKCAA